MLFAFLIGAPDVWPQKAERLREIIAAIAMGANSAERRQAITGYLEGVGIEFRLEEFVDRRMRRGTNIIATVPGSSAKTFLLGAHYDRIAVGQGALDNGAGCAVLLDLLASFKSKPLPGFTVRAIFFDLEEGGLSGSQAYFESIRSRQPPEYAVNLDIFGYGDAIFATSSKDDGLLVSALRQAGGEMGISVRLLPPAQYPSSDHRSMMSAGIETLGMSLIDAAEIDDVVGVITRRPSSSVPPVLSTIHTANDTLAIVRPADVEKAVPVVERMIRLTDR